MTEVHNVRIKGSYRFRTLCSITISREEFEVMSFVYVTVRYQVVDWMASPFVP